MLLKNFFTNLLDIDVPSYPSLIEKLKTTYNLSGKEEVVELNGYNEWLVEENDVTTPCLQVLGDLFSIIPLSKYHTDSVGEGDDKVLLLYNYDRVIIKFPTYDSEPYGFFAIIKR